MTNMSFKLKIFVTALTLPFFLGLLLSSRVINEDRFLSYLQAIRTQLPLSTPDSLLTDEECDQALSSLFQRNILESVSVVVHRNGESDSCGRASVDWDALSTAIRTFGFCPNPLDKFDVESFLTHLLAEYVQSCDSDINDLKDRGFLGHCYRGEDRTPILLDHEYLVPLPSTQTLPCRFHTREGLRITSLQQLSKLLEEASGACSANETCSSTPQLHLYAVPAGRVFMHAPSFVGEIFELPHVQGPLGMPVSLKVLSVSPKVFDVYNFFTKEESEDLVKRALEETSETHRIKRSTTGTTGHHLNSQRTSENGFDTHGKTSVAVKKRCLSILGYDEYIESHGDGLQILRYNQTTAYIPHMDYLDDLTGTLKHDYDSSHKGGNRYATFLLYMTDMEEGAGGETVFTKGWPVGQTEEDHVPYREALRRLRESGDVAMVLKEGSWEEEMVAKCRSRLALRPSSARTVLFYSQLPNGEQDPASLHGGCPVLKGEKWAANLWVWNTPRDGFAGHPRNPKYVEDEGTSPTPQYEQIKATFVNSGKSYDEAELYFNGDTFWAKFGKHDPPVHVNTYETHKWDVKVEGNIVKSWNIFEKDGKTQTFTL